MIIETKNLFSGVHILDNQVKSKRTSVVQNLSIATILNDLSLRAKAGVFLLGEASETPLVGLDDLLTTRELVLGTTKSLPDVRNSVVTATDRKKNLTDTDTGNETLGLTESTTHSGLKSISTSTRQHLVDTENVVRVDSDTHVEGVLASHLHDVLVASNTGSFESFTGDLFLLKGAQVNAVGETVDGGLLVSKIVNSELAIRDTTAVARLDVRLVLTITVASSGT